MCRVSGRLRAEIAAEQHDHAAIKRGRHVVQPALGQHGRRAAGDQAAGVAEITGLEALDAGKPRRARVAELRPRYPREAPHELLPAAPLLVRAGRRFDVRLDEHQSGRPRVRLDPEHLSGHGRSPAREPPAVLGGALVVDIGPAGGPVEDARKLAGLTRPRDAVRPLPERVPPTAPGLVQDRHLPPGRPGLAKRKQFVAQAH